MFVLSLSQVGLLLCLGFIFCAALLLIVFHKYIGKLFP